MNTAIAATTTADAPATSRRRPGPAAVAFIAVVFAATSVASAVLLPPMVAGSLWLAVALAWFVRRAALSWTGLLLTLVAVVMLVPVRRYSLPVPANFALEPYRIVLVVAIALLITALLVDPAFRWRRVAFGWPIGIFFAALLTSVVANIADVSATGKVGGVVSAMGQYALLFAVFYVARQLLDRERMVTVLLTAVTLLGGLVGLLAMVESATGVNVFLMLNRVLPLTLLRDDGDHLRDGVLRAYGSAQHPIALAVALCMVVPLAAYLFRHSPWPRAPLARRAVFGLTTLFLLGGVLATVSRTGAVLLAVLLTAIVILVPRVGLTLIAASLAFVGAAALVAPVATATTFGGFFDVEELVSSQRTSAGSAIAGGRLADIEPALEQASQSPLFGAGVGARSILDPTDTALLLDNQVLGILLDAGVVGVLGLAALFLVPMTMLVRFAFAGTTSARYGAMALAISVSLLAYGVSLFLFDAFGFMQTVMLMCLLLAAGAWLLTESGRDPEETAQPTAVEARIGA